MNKAGLSGIDFDLLRSLVKEEAEEFDKAEEEMSKTLGQIAYEAAIESLAGNKIMISNKWHDLSSETELAWETAAAAIIIEYEKIKKKNGEKMLVACQLGWANDRPCEVCANYSDESYYKSDVCKSCRVTEFISVIKEGKEGYEKKNEEAKMCESPSKTGK